MRVEGFNDAYNSIDSMLGEGPELWDLKGSIPAGVLTTLGERGLLCPQVPTEYGGLGLDSTLTGELTAYVGERCSSARSVMTSQGMAAWTIQRLGNTDQKRQYLSDLTSGRIAAVCFSEPQAGSDLSAISTSIRNDGDSIILTGRKIWVTGADYADYLVVFGRNGAGAVAVVVPASCPGVTINKINDPLGCRAAGHANIEFDAVRLPSANILGGCEQSLQLLVTTALTFGRMSVAWGCVGILRACLAEATKHARSRQQFGKPLSGHQLIARHLSELFVLEQVAMRSCEYASRCWDSHSPDMITATVLAKHISAQNAVQGASTAVQVLASAGVEDGRPVARAYRDAKLMEIIEGSTEICQIILAEHALSVVN